MCFDTTTKPAEEKVFEPIPTKMIDNLNCDEYWALQKRIVLGLPVTTAGKIIDKAYYDKSTKGQYPETLSLLRALAIDAGAEPVGDDELAEISASVKTVTH